MDEALKYNIAITLVKGVGNQVAKNLIAYVGSAEGVLKEKKANLEKIPGIGEFISSQIASQEVLNRAEEEVEFIVKNGISPLYFKDKEYPFRLKECIDAPLMLYSKGICDFNIGRYLGIVGTRNITDTGRENCKKLIDELSVKVPQLTIVSGMAYGVDICAHKVSVDNRMTTIGVLGHGLDRIYPSSHRPTAVKMLGNGALLTEYISGTNPDKPNFVMRNRIIAGTSDAVVVVESGEKGGSLITAEMANEYNRDVFAFPGRVGDELSAGCNALIKNHKAMLIENADDLCRMMNWDIETKSSSVIQTSLFQDLSDEEQKIISLLRQQYDGIQVNEAALMLSKPFSQVSSLLLQLEFKGMVRCLPGSLYKIVK
jgi:DNA processing protein